MKRIVSRALAAVALAVLASGASAQVQAPVYPSWIALVVPELPASRNMPAPSADVTACFEAHSAALAKKPQAVWPLVIDHLGADPVRRDCAMAAQVGQLVQRWRGSSPTNSYGPFISFMSKQNQSLAAKSDLEKCRGRQFIYDAAIVFNGIMAGTLPQHTYSWAKPAADAPCLAAAH